MPTLVIPMGIPGCGKSSWGKLLGMPTVSSDDIRAEMGDVYDQSRNGEVFGEFHARITDHLIRGNNVYADATNLGVLARTNLRDIVSTVKRDYIVDDPIETHVVLFRNLAQAITRNLQRDRVVPPEAMVRMIEKYEQAVFDINFEGYTHVTEVSAVR